jgi:hypothetical protein
MAYLLNIYFSFMLHIYYGLAVALPHAINFLRPRFDRTDSIWIWKRERKWGGNPLKGSYNFYSSVAFVIQVLTPLAKVGHVEVSLLPDQ